MRKQAKPKSIIVTAAFLAVLVLVSAIVLGSNLAAPRPDTGVISLVPTAEAATAADTKDTAAEPAQTTAIGKKDTQDGVHDAGRENAPAGTAEPEKTEAEGLTPKAAEQKAVANPGMIVEDQDGIVWSATETKVEIFHKEYGGEYPITVLSSNGDKLIAPGTEDKYSFSLKNTGNVSLNYKVWLEAYIEPEGLWIPIEVRMKAHNGTWMTGSDNKWAEFLTLDGLKDEATLMKNSYANYTLEWCWPFERTDGDGLGANDAYDTWLGNRAVDEALSVTVIIHTLASYDSAADTGDDTNLIPYIALAAAALIGILFLFVYKKKEAREEQKRIEQADWVKEAEREDD